MVSPIASSTNATPPARGLSKCLYGEPCFACLAGVKRVPSTKFITETGMSANFRQARRVASVSRPASSGRLAIVCFE